MTKWRKWREARFRRHDKADSEGAIRVNTAFEGKHSARATPVRRGVGCYVVDIHPTPDARTARVHRSRLGTSGYSGPTANLHNSCSPKFSTRLSERCGLYLEGHMRRAAFYERAVAQPSQRMDPQHAMQAASTVRHALGPWNYGNSALNSNYGANYGDSALNSEMSNNRKSLGKNLLPYSPPDAMM